MTSTGPHTPGPTPAGPKTTGPDKTDASARQRRLAGAFSSSMLWNVANTGASQIITMVIFIFLTYQLEPYVFGVFALGVVFTDYFNHQARVAATDALFQRRQFDAQACNTAFWTSMAFFIGATLILFVSGGLLAGATGEPKLTYILPALALTLLPVPFSIPPVVILMRRYDFKGTAMRNIIANIAAGIAAIATALSAWPEWTLVVQRMVNVIASGVFLMARAQWIPQLQFARDYATGFLKDAARIFLAQSVAVSSLRVLDVIIAVTFGTASVGLLRVAARLTEAVYGAFAMPVGSLSVLMLTGETQEPAEKSDMYLKLSQMLSLICLPVFAGIALTSQEVTLVLLDHSYAGAAPLLAVLCTAGLFAPITYLRNATLTAMRHLNRLLIYSIIDVVIVLCAAFALSQYSVQAVVASLLVMHLGRVVLAKGFLLTEMHTTLGAFIRAVSPAYIAIALMAGVVLAIHPLVESLSAWIRLVILAPAGAVTYFAYLAVFHRQWALTGLRMLRPKHSPSAALQEG